VIRRPTGAAATTRAASTFQGDFQADDAALTSSPAAVAYEAMRTTLHLAPAMRTALKRRALDRDTTMGDLIRAAISSALQAPRGLAAASMEQRGASGGVRTTLDLPRPVHRRLKRLAADEDTSLQALVVAAILQTYPDVAAKLHRTAAGGNGAPGPGGGTGGKGGNSPFGTGGSGGSGGRGGKGGVGSTGVGGTGGSARSKGIGAP
jgi:predicted DNA-binding ribbon-helix-helix protein